MRVLIIIPAYNEEANIERVVHTVTAFAARCDSHQVDYIVINDGSVDRTEEICRREGFETVHLVQNLGIGGAVQTGYLLARQLTYGSGNPLLLGTEQGETAIPIKDSGPEYEAYVKEQFNLRYADYLNEDGTLKEPEKSRFLSLQKDKIRAEYRMREWYERDPDGMIHAYLVEKPSIMVYKIYYGKTLFGMSTDKLTDLRELCYLLAIGSFFLAFVLKKYRAEMVFLALLYVSNLYIYAYTFAYSRYGQTLVHFWYIMIGIGLCLLCLGLRKAFQAVESFFRQKEEAAAPKAEEEP